ncbi:MAG: protein-L-isoaspartate(D-aspartate) O-methyltransferase [Gammaproteobacteria bacterium]|jgi:protein-L-isoaspartate(D-aspartate) O-methyltransferase
MGIYLNFKIYWSEFFSMYKFIIIIFGLLWSIAPISFAQMDYLDLRNKLADEIEAMVVDTEDYIGVKKLDSLVIEAIRKVPRHEFVPDIYKPYAYENRPLPIGENQTISQPYIVALMTNLGLIDKDSIVLEIGTGSGYQAAILAEIALHVYTIEIIESLGIKAKKILNNLGYKNITVRIGDGYDGWIEYANYDAIIVTAAPDKVPQSLLDQLNPGGRLIIPVGPQTRTQHLQVITKDQMGNVEIRNVMPVGFVPLTRKESVELIE